MCAFFFCSDKGKADSLKFEWLLTPWSKCSQTCGGSGFQVRAVQCIVRHNNVTKSVEASLCEDAGLANPDAPGVKGRPSMPATVQKCGLDTCPHWVAGSWTPCHQSRCFTWNTGNQSNIQMSHLTSTLLDVGLRLASNRNDFNFQHFICLRSSAKEATGLRHGQRHLAGPAPVRRS